LSTRSTTVCSNLTKCRRRNVSAPSSSSLHDLLSRESHLGHRSTPSGSSETSPSDEVAYTFDMESNPFIDGQLRCQVVRDEHRRSGAVCSRRCDHKRRPSGCHWSTNAMQHDVMRAGVALDLEYSISESTHKPHQADTDHRYLISSLRRDKRWSGESRQMGPFCHQCTIVTLLTAASGTAFTCLERLARVSAALP
jgi:hypothetical protein